MGKERVFVIYVGYILVTLLILLNFIGSSGRREVYPKNMLKMLQNYERRISKLKEELKLEREKVRKMARVIEKLQASYREAEETFDSLMSFDLDKFDKRINFKSPKFVYRRDIFTPFYIVEVESIEKESLLNFLFSKKEVK